MMKPNNVDVFIYVKSAEEQGSISDIVKRVSQHSGVSDVTQHLTIKNMLHVNYDASSISSADILQAINNQHQNAVMVGM